jgi:hypothetical protein
MSSPTRFLSRPLSSILEEDAAKSTDVNFSREANEGVIGKTALVRPVTLPLNKADEDNDDDMDRSYDEEDDEDEQESPLKEALDAIDTLAKDSNFNDFNKENVDGNAGFVKLSSILGPTSESRRSQERSEEVVEEPCVERIYPMLGGGGNNSSSNSNEIPRTSPGKDETSSRSIIIGR